MQDLDIRGFTVPHDTNLPRDYLSMRSPDVALGPCGLGVRPEEEEAGMEREGWEGEAGRVSRQGTHCYLYMYLHVRHECICLVLHLEPLQYHAHVQVGRAHV